MAEGQPPAAQSFEIVSGFYRLFTDGGKKPGPRPQDDARFAIGVMLQDPKGKVVPNGTISETIGPVESHNVAEYRALITGLELARRHSIDYLAVFSDSRTVVNQVNELWSHGTHHLQELCTQVQDLLKTFKATQVSWVPREWNTEAHKLAAQAFRR